MRTLLWLCAIALPLYCSLSLCFARRSIEIEKVAVGGYTQQATVTLYPPAWLRLLGAQPDIRTFVCSYNFPTSCGWYEIPEMTELSNIGRLSTALEREARKTAFIDRYVETR